MFAKIISCNGKHLAITLGAVFFFMAWAGASGISLLSGSQAAANSFIVGALFPQGTPSPSPTASPTPSPSPTASPTPSPSATPTPSPGVEHCKISLSAATYVVGEDAGQLIVGVNRVCDRVRDSKVDFFTQSRSASTGADFTSASGRIEFADGETSKTITLTIKEDTAAEGNENFNLFLNDPGGSAMLVNPTSALITILDNDGAPGSTPSPSPTPTPSPFPTPSPSPNPSPNNEHCKISLSSASYTVGEGAGELAVALNRTCDEVRDSKVDFFTRSGTASAQSDFTFTAGRVFFADGETSKTINLLITDDTVLEPNETFTLFLADPGGSASLLTPSSATITIVENDVSSSTSNPVDQPAFFVQQHFADFLNRSADPGGLAYWSGRINECGGNEDCVRDRRIGVSAAFFIEQEFQDTGNYVYRHYRATFGRKPQYAEFMPDRGRLVVGSDLAVNKVQFSDDWVRRPEFELEFPESLSAHDFVNRLMDRAGLFPYQTERERLVNEMFSGKTRSQVLRDVIEMPEFKQREYNRAFVLMEYFGYLRRDPDSSGYEFWLGVVNSQEASNYRGMVCAFLTSAEMQGRFSSLQTRTDAECSR